MTLRQPHSQNGSHPPAPTLPLLSRAGRAALAAAERSQTAALDPSIAALLRQVAHDGEGVRALLDRLAQQLAVGDVAAASASIQQALEPARQLDIAQARFADAQHAAQTALDSVRSDVSERWADHILPDPALLRRLQAAAQEAAAALDDLALCAEAWASLLNGGVG